MWKNLKKNLEEAFQRIKFLGSKLSLKAEEKAKLARIQVSLRSLQKEMDGIMIELGSAAFAFAEKGKTSDILEEESVKGIMAEADKVHKEVLKVQEEMDHIRKDYEAKIEGLSPHEAEERKAA